MNRQGVFERHVCEPSGQHVTIQGPIAIDTIIAPEVRDYKQKYYITYILYIIYIHIVTIQGPIAIDTIIAPEVRAGQISIIYIYIIIYIHIAAHLAHRTCGVNVHVKICDIYIITMHTELFIHGSTCNAPPMCRSTHPVRRR